MPRPNIDKLRAKAKRQKRSEDGKFSKGGGGKTAASRDPKQGMSPQEMLRAWKESGGKGGMPAGWRDTQGFKQARQRAKAKRSAGRTGRL